MSKNNENNTDEVVGEVTENKTGEKSNEPTVAELIAKIDQMSKVIEELQSEKAQTEKKVNKPKADPFKNLVDFELPLTQYEYEDVAVCLNGRHYQIKRGYKVRIPECIVCAINENRAQDLETFNRIRALVENTPN